MPILHWRNWIEALLIRSGLIYLKVLLYKFCLIYVQIMLLFFVPSPLMVKLLLEEKYGDLRLVGKDDDCKNNKTHGWSIGISFIDNLQILIIQCTIVDLLYKGGVKLSWLLKGKTCSKLKSEWWLFSMYLLRQLGMNRGFCNYRGSYHWRIMILGGNRRQRLIGLDLVIETPSITTRVN